MIEPPIWTGRLDISLSWRDDDYGIPGRALYINQIYVGWVMQSPSMVKAGTPWRAWIMNTMDGTEFGWRSTEQEAKDALVDAVLKALRDE